MSFLIRFGFNSFVEDLAPESVVYGVAFAETGLEKSTGVILLTSNAGLEGGPIHAVRVVIETSEAATLEVAVEAHNKLAELLRLKGMTWKLGVLLTEGLNDALRYYSKSPPVGVAAVEGWLAKTKGAAKKENASE